MKGEKNRGHRRKKLTDNVNDIEEYQALNVLARHNEKGNIDVDCPPIDSMKTMVNHT